VSSPGVDRGSGGLFSKDELDVDLDDPVPDRPTIVKELERPESSLEELTAYYGPSYLDKLYR